MARSTAPTDLGARGRRLWRSLTDRDSTLNEALNPLREVAIEACRTADRCERLDVICREVEPVIEGRSGPITHPAFAEARQQATMLKQLVISLRLPDQKTGVRPQSRPGAATRRPVPGKVSSLDRARAAAG